MSEACIGGGNSEQDLAGPAGLSCLSVPEVQMLRLVCKDWRRAVRACIHWHAATHAAGTCCGGLPKTPLPCRAALRRLPLHGPAQAADQLELYDEDSLEEG